MNNHYNNTDQAEIVSRRRREKELADFLVSLDSYQPTLPESVIKHSLQKGGAGTSDERLVKFVALAADRFIATVINDACRYREKRRQAAVATAPANKKGKRDLDEMDERERDRDRECLIFDDLAASLSERGIKIGGFKEEPDDD